MHPHTSAVREVLQWITEIQRIEKAREVELSEEPGNSLGKYREDAKKLADVKKGAISGALGKVAEIDKRSCGERLRKDNTLHKWDEFLKAHHDEAKDNPAFKEAGRLLGLAQSADDPLEAQKRLAEARKALWEAKPPAPGIEPGAIPGVPSGQGLRKIDPDEAVKALQRKDLRKHIARNDTWGDFDPAKALGGDASEEDLKVLLNIIESAAEADRQDAAWKDYETQVTEAVKKRGHPRSEPIKIYKEVILGAGASAAYYIASNFGQFDMPSTMILGELQPWAEERGKSGNINHPHNQIDPQQKGSKPIEEDEEGLAERAEFSRRIAEIIAKVPYTASNISKVRRCPEDFFEIETNKGKFYASKVTNALGIGKQKKPSGIQGSADKKTKDMDSFKRALEGKSIRQAYGEIKSVCVSGGNAAIDVITAIVRDQGKSVAKDLKIHWIVGESGAPAFLNGTDNALASEAYPHDQDLASGAPIEKGNMKVYRGYLTGASGDSPVRVTCTYKAPTPENKDATGTHTIEADLVVYGTGPDVVAMQAMFVDENKGGRDKPEALTLEPVIDKGRHFNIQIEEKNPSALVNKLKGKLTNEQAAKELQGWLEDPSLETVVDNSKDVIVSVKSQDKDGAKSSMQFVGASGARLKTTASTLTPMSDPKLTHEAIATLPENVVGNDQLTSSRARVEAQFNALPTSTEDVPLVAVQGGINFITSNQTVIRVHIAECYPKIPPGLGDYVTGQIIFERSRNTDKGKKPKTPVPMPSDDDPWMENLSLDQQRAFQDKWTQRLQDISARIA